ncbi:MAG: carboxymuconolactone decarboxylase family protein [Chloroflexi bacterium]|nr:carboxymuconolactone decarboxylase family protein [Chloroflexota bacterium]
MARVTEIKQREALPEAQGLAFDDIVASRGAIRGPFGVLLHSPELAQRAAALGGYLRYESSLSPRIRETAVMATAGLNDCVYEWAAHEPIAREAGVPTTVIDALRERRPADLAQEDRDIYELAVGIIQAHRVPADLFDRLKARLGLTGLVEVVAAIGYWSFVAATLNTFEVLPADH